MVSKLLSYDAAQIKRFEFNIFRYTFFWEAKTNIVQEGNHDTYNLGASKRNGRNFQSLNKNEKLVIFQFDCRVGSISSALHSASSVN